MRRGFCPYRTMKGLLPVALWTRLLCVNSASGNQSVLVVLLIVNEDSEILLDLLVNLFGTDHPSEDARLLMRSA